MSGGRGGSLLRTMPDKGGGRSENPSFGRTSFVNGPKMDLKYARLMYCNKLCNYLNYWIFNYWILSWIL